MLSRDKIRQKRSNKIWGFPRRRNLSLCANALEKTKRRKDDFFKHPLFKGIPRKNIARITASYILKINLFNQESNHEKQKNELKNTEFHFFTNVFSLST